MLPGTWQNVRSGKQNRFSETTRQLVRLTGVTRLRLSQSRDCTSRTGRSAGVFDARSRPGTDCETVRGDRTCSTF